MEWQPRTIRARIAMSAFLLLGGALTVAGLLIDAETREIAVRGLDRRLAAEAEALATLVSFDGVAVRFDDSDDVARAYGRANQSAYFQIVTTAGIVARSRSLGDFTFPRPHADNLRPLTKPRGRRTDEAFVDGPHSERLRLVTLALMRVPEGHAGIEGDERTPRVTVAVQVARDLDDVAHALEEVRGDLFIAMPFALLVGTLGVYLMSARALRPIARMSADASAIAAASIDRRLDVDHVDGELRELAGTLNAAFGRLASAVERERRFAADAAHELRTPLTVLRVRVELALSREREASEYAAALTDAQQGIERLGRVVEDLLLLARVEHAPSLNERVDVRSAVLASVDAARLVTAQRPLPIRLELGADELPVVGSVVLLERVVGNLIENAIAHGASPLGIDISAFRSADGQFAEIVVADRGPGIPPELAPHVFERFARGDPSRSRESGGSGLGLAIVLGIVRAHGGDATVAPRIGGGTECRVRLPLASSSS